MDLQGDMPLDINLLQEDYNIDAQFLGESQHIPISDQESPPEVEIITSKTSRQGGNFTIEEDKLIVSAWLNTSLDAVHENENKKSTFYKRIVEYFHEFKDFISDRTVCSIMNRWSSINTYSNKFCGFLAQVESRHESGLTEKDNIVKARIMYQNILKSNFQFEHCWILLRSEPKWLQYKPKEIHQRGSPQTPVLINQALGDDASHDNTVYLERPIGRKAERAKRKRQESEKEDIVVLMKKKTKLLEESHDQETELIHMKGKNIRFELLIAEERVRIENERIRIEEKRLHFKQSKEDERISIEKERLRFEKSKEDERMRREDEREKREDERLRLKRIKKDERIIMMDTSGLSVTQQQYYHQLQMEILQRIG